MEVGVHRLSECGDARMFDDSAWIKELYLRHQMLNPGSSIYPQDKAEGRRVYEDKYQAFKNSLMLRFNGDA